MARFVLHSVASVVAAVILAVVVEGGLGRATNCHFPPRASIVIDVDQLRLADQHTPDSIGDVYFWNYSEAHGGLLRPCYARHRRHFEIMSPQVLAPEQVDDLREQMYRRLLDAGYTRAEAGEVFLPDRVETAMNWPLTAMSMIGPLAGGALLWCLLWTCARWVRRNCSYDRIASAIDANRCPSCGYDIRNLPQPRCPECGERWEDDCAGQ